MISCLIRYEIDPTQVHEFEQYAKMWIPLVNKYGGVHHGYFLPHEGKDYEAMALFSFSSLAAYEKYRESVREDSDFKIAEDYKAKKGFVLRIERQFMRPVLR